MVIRPMQNGNDGGKAGKAEPPTSHRNGVRLRWFAYFLPSFPQIYELVDEFNSLYPDHGSVCH